jgi:hypothetical protein
MCYVKKLCELVAQRAVANQIEENKGGILWKFGFATFHTAPSGSADAATGAVFEKKDWVLVRQSHQFGKLVGGFKRNPSHYERASAGVSTCVKAGQALRLQALMAAPANNTTAIKTSFFISLSFITKEVPIFRV